MKNLIISLSVLFSLAVPALIPVAVSAIDVVPQCSDSHLQTTHVCQDIKSSSADTQNPAVRFIDIVIQVLGYVIGVAAVVGIIVSGMRMILSNGDSNAIATARKSLIYSLIGIFIAVVAETLVAFVLSKL